MLKVVSGDQAGARSWVDDVIDGDARDRNVRCGQRARGVAERWTRWVLPIGHVSHFNTRENAESDVPAAVFRVLAWCRRWGRL